MKGKQGLPVVCVEPTNAPGTRNFYMQTVS